TKKRKRGRPLGSGGKINGALANIKALDAFSVPAFIEVTLPAQVVKPATARGSEKVFTPSPFQLGPIQINNHTTWETLLQDAATAVSVGKENLVTTSMRWSWVAAKGKALKTTRWFPLHDESSFHVFMNMLKKTVANDALGGDEFIVISMAQPITVRHHAELPWLQAPSADSASGLPQQHLPPSGLDHLPPAQSHLQVLPRSSQVPAIPAHSNSFKTGSLDDDVPKLVKYLLWLHGEVDACGVHPGMRCFYYAPLGWHFELTDIRVKAWACALLKNQPGVDLRTPPIGSEWWKASDANRSRSPQILSQVHGGSLPAHAVQPNSGSVAPVSVGYGAPQMVPTAGVFPGYASSQLTIPAMHAPPPVMPPAQFYAGVPAQGATYSGMYTYPGAAPVVAPPLPAFMPAHSAPTSHAQPGPSTYNPHYSFSSRHS
ncbi:hypothetical protein C8T65DRAFT_704059, partial [Cerioporus squamosus]